MIRMHFYLLTDPSKDHGAEKPIAKVSLGNPARTPPSSFGMTCSIPAPSSLTTSKTLSAVYGCVITYDTSIFQ